MLNKKLITKYLTKVKNRRRQFALIQLSGGILEYYDLFSLGFLFLYLLQVYNGHKLIIHGLALITLTSYLFIAIPKFVAQIFPDNGKLEAMVFIHNYEYFGFNLLRGGFLLLAATIFNLPLSLPIYLDLLIYSMWVFLLLAVAAIGILHISSKPAKI